MGVWDFIRFVCLIVCVLCNVSMLRLRNEARRYYEHADRTLTKAKAFYEMANEVLEEIRSLKSTEE